MEEFEGYRALLADDEEISREIAAGIVRSLGAECETVADGKALLERLKDASAPPVDIVLTDIHMPGMGGIEACAAFRASDHPRAKSLPIVGMTADADGTVFDRAIAAGMNSMTMKPIKASVLSAHFILTLKDNRANDVFREHVQLALDAAKAKSYFFSTVSHDIRTPLNAIIGFSQMLKVGFESEEERRSAVDSIIVSGTTLMRLINDVLDLSKLEAGKMTINLEPTDCSRLAWEIVESFRVSNTKRNLEIFGEITKIPPLMVDPQRLRQILFNLVGNAVKFTERGHVRLRVAFTPDKSGNAGELIVEVADTGCGIGKEDLGKIAAPYVQIGSKTSARHGGTGLGLAITKQLTAAMGGSLSVKSTPGKGSTFSVVIPQAKMAATMGKGEPKPETAGAAGKSFSGLRVLVVDDVKVNILVLRMMLAKIGVSEVAGAVNGLDALREMERTRFDIILTDMWMPEMDGEQLARAIRANSKFAGLPVIAVTADVELNAKFRDMGFSGILLKPVTIETLRAALEVAVAGGQ